VLLAVRELLLLDLKALFRGLAAAEQLINLAMELVSGSSCSELTSSNAPIHSAYLQLRSEHQRWRQMGHEQN
jgi:hypothetical protein